jgi:dimethylamine/trimethylamine dehydrogenase
MARDPYYDVLFEPVQIGPVTARNRFYQVPHCTGMGYNYPNTLAAMRETKAEGGWGVVCTEYCSIQASSDDSPFPSATLWDEGDIKNQALMAEKVHRHGALAGVQLWYGGSAVGNVYSREPLLDVGSFPSLYRNDPFQSKIMTKKDIRELRRWQVAAAKRAVTAGFDLVYMYATHGYLHSHFLSSEWNQRTDEYGGSLENRVRLIREMIMDTKDAVGHKCAVAVRFSADGDYSGDGVIDNVEQKEMLAMLADLPDLWDINITDYSIEMGSSRFVKEAALEAYIDYVKELTDKPVASVGRFTSPATMVRQVKEGRLDLVGAARPSIADPYIPKKIEEGRLDDIRECIGCNICYATNTRCVPMRCTQNPAMGEEWRRGWHPEKIAPRGSDDTILVVGAGPAGLEAAHALGKRGYEVALAEATRELGGRVKRECRLPGLSEWRRVVEYRIQQLKGLPNVNIYRESRLSVAEILEFGFQHVIIATGATWRGDGIGRWYQTAPKGFDHANVFSPDDIMDGKIPEGSVAVFDDDHYYMGSVVAEKLREAGCEVLFATSSGFVGEWSRNSDEQEMVQGRLLTLGVEVFTGNVIGGFDGTHVDIECVYTGKRVRRPARSVVTVTARKPDEDLYLELNRDKEKLAAAGIKSVRRIGDCLAPGIIVAAVWSGHRAAREMDAPAPGDVPFKRERVIVA